MQSCTNRHDAVFQDSTSPSKRQGGPGITATLIPELLRQCFVHLPREDLSNTSLVHRAWLSPSRDVYWDTLLLTLRDDSAELLVKVLGERTTVPRKIKGLTIDESEDFEDRDEKETLAWQHAVVKIMGLEEESGTGTLIVQWLKIEREDDATPWMLDQPNVNFLGVGDFVLAKAVERRDEDDEKESSGLAASAHVEAQPLNGAVHLDRVRHLNIFCGPESLAWTHLVPCLAKGSLTELKTLVYDSCDNGVIAKLVGAAAPNLLSLAISPEHPGININMSSARSLVNLSIQTGSHPHNEHVLAAAVAAVSSAPASVEHVFLGIGPDTLEPAEQPDGANALWASIDAALASMPKLRRVVGVMLIIGQEACNEMFPILWPMLCS
ncbi:hypothetical protein HYQ45_012083 [Verticillium longisporum]|uniref:F-box domain-containing protein n=1 Tax=Verticillium longisporum TaxID=100787 RepID=A0A8I3AKK3_VERLO|nr:hypothetical protein HYQ45_012083 [Verticillium longisporum]